MELRDKIVWFDKYCGTCKNRDTNENEEPCNECLTVGVREYSHKPEKYEEKE